MKKKIFKCANCGKETTSYYKNAKYCSRKCMNEKEGLKKKTCPVCGKKFKPTWKGQIHCNIKCYAKSEKLRDEAKNSLLIKYNGIAKWRENTQTKEFSNKGQFKKGMKPWNYKRDDEFKKLRQQIRKCKEYLDWKGKIMKRDGREGKSLQVHHLKPFNQILIDNKITSIEEARKCDELWDTSIGITLTKGEHNIVSLLERLNKISPELINAIIQIIEEKNKVKVNYKEVKLE